jgi:hypothetical protein
VRRTIAASAFLLLLALPAAAQTPTVAARAAAASDATRGPLPRLHVAAGGRYLVRDDGTPFLYLADTGWELFHRLTREEARRYLSTRAAQRFTVIQAVALAELDGLTVPNAYGDLPLVDRDPTHPAVTPGASPTDSRAYDYWDHVDFVVDEANRRGLYVAMLPTWARYVKDEPVITAANAQRYGEFLGRRYRDRSVIWILGGDRPADGLEEVWRALAKGIAIGTSGREDYDAVLMSFHPTGAQSSSRWFHDDRWLDFDMQQTGHEPATKRTWEMIERDYARTPAKPVVDGEMLYEDHPIGFREGARTWGFSTDAHVRQRAYWHLFAGAAGIAYGDHAVWQFYAPGRAPINGPLFFWEEALHRPGADEMQFVRTLWESRPALARVPDQSLIADPLDAWDHIAAMRGPDHLFVYSGSGHPFTVTMGRISGARVRAWWYDPRTGTSTEIGTFDNTGTRTFTPQFVGLGSDWVLVLDDASRGYPAPGRLVAAPAH